MFSKSKRFKIEVSQFERIDRLAELTSSIHTTQLLEQSLDFFEKMIEFEMNGGTLYVGKQDGDVLRLEAITVLHHNA